MRDPLSLISRYAADGSALREKFFELHMETIRMASFRTALSIAQGGKLMLCGNGGSAADAQHVAGEFVNRFLMDRPGLPAIALTTDSSVLTAIANDDSFDRVFARQLEALARKGDVLLAISTSGNSPNILAALDAAREKELYAIGLSGGSGGKMAGKCDLLIAVPDERTPLIQEMHLAAEHVFCELVDYYLFENVTEIRNMLYPEEK